MNMFNLSGKRSVFWRRPRQPRWRFIGWKIFGKKCIIRAPVGVVLAFPSLPDRLPAEIPRVALICTRHLKDGSCKIWTRTFRSKGVRRGSGTLQMAEYGVAALTVDKCVDRPVRCHFEGDAIGFLNKGPRVGSGQVRPRRMKKIWSSMIRRTLVQRDM